MIYFFKGFYYEKSEEEIIQNNYVMMDLISKSLVNSDYNELYSRLELTANINSGQAWIIDKEGYHIMSYPSIIEGDGSNDQIRFVEFDEVLAGGIVTRRVEADYFERPMLLVALPIMKYDQIEGALLTFTSVAGINSTIRQVQRMMFFSSLIAVVLAMIIAYRWSKTLSTPLKEMSKTALELSKGNFGKQIDIESKGEIATLAESMNYLSNKLKKTIKDLTEEKNKLKYVLTEMEEGVIVINLKDELMLINDSAKDLLGLKGKEVLNNQFVNLIDSDNIRSSFLEAKKKDEIVSSEFFIEKDNFKKRILLNCTPVHIKSDKIWGVVGLFNDISQRWRFEKLQQDFVANVSHELKTPLSSIKGSTEILLDGIVNDETVKEEYLEIILEETDRLSGLVNEILNLSELDSFTLELEMEQLSVINLMRDVVHLFKKGEMSEEKKLVLNFPKVDYKIYASKEKLKQVMLNLLDNACKFSGAGSKVELGCRKEEDELKFWIQDQGIGIPEKESKNIWERFYKVDKAHTPDEKGSGLGLSIVKQIILEHRGRVFVESKLGEGSTFGFYLPVS